MSATLQQDASTPPERPRSRVAGVLLNQPLRNLGIGVTALVLGTTAAFGGLRTNTARAEIAPVVIGQRTPIAPFDITVTKAVWTDSLPGVSLKPGDRRLVVAATVRNVQDVSLSGGLLKDAVKLTGVDGVVVDTFTGKTGDTSLDQISVLDASTVEPVQPGLDYAMAFLFEQRGSVPPPTRVTLTLVGRTWRQDSLDHQMKWLDPAPVARSAFDMGPSAAQARKDQANGTPTPTPRASSSSSGARA